MSPNTFIFLFPLIVSSLGILRPNPDKPESDRRQGNPNPNLRPLISRPEINPFNNARPQQPQQIQTPSRELLPPSISPAVPVLQSNSLPPAPPQFQAQQSPPQQSQPETLELLPPVEIPPETPIDNLPPQSSRDFINRPIVFEPPTNSVNQFGPQPQGPRPQPTQFIPPSSLLPTTGSGSGDPFSNTIPGNRPGEQRAPIFREAVAPVEPQPTHDPGLDCLGTCDCPPDFNFVCGSNRFLYQNDCALECDKKCHPGLVKLDMAECS